MGKMSLQSHFVVLKSDDVLGLRKGEVIPAMVQYFEGATYVRVMFVRKFIKKTWFWKKTIIEHKDVNMELPLFMKMFKPIKGAKYDPEMIRLLYE